MKINKQYDTTIDLHGLRAYEVEEVLDKCLNSCRYLGKKHVIVIHGRGDVLPDLVKQYLDTCSFIQRYYTAPSKLGGEGVTIVEF